MNLGEYRAAVPQWARIAVGVAVAALLGAVVASQHQAVFEWFAAQSPLPERHAETGNRLTFSWAVAYFLVTALLPTALAYVVAGRGWSGWLGVAAYALVWFQVAATVTTGPRAVDLQAWSLVVLALYELFKYGAGRMDSDSEPFMSSWG